MEELGTNLKDLEIIVNNKSNSVRVVEDCMIFSFYYKIIGFLLIPKYSSTPEGSQLKHKYSFSFSLHILISVRHE